jgi:hypothetical protein
MADVHETFLAAVQMARMYSRQIGDKKYEHVYGINTEATRQFIANWNPSKQAAETLHSMSGQRGISIASMQIAQQVNWKEFEHAIRFRVTSSSISDMKDTGSVADLIETWSGMLIFHPDGKNAPSSI